MFIVSGGGMRDERGFVMRIVCVRCMCIRVVVVSGGLVDVIEMVERARHDDPSGNADDHKHQTDHECHASRTAVLVSAAQHAHA